MVKHYNDAGDIERNIRGKPKTLCTTKTESYRIPESLSAFCRIVSLTAAKTRRILLVSVACVKLREPRCKDDVTSGMSERTY